MTRSQDEEIIRMLQRAKNHGVANYQFANNRILRYSAVIERLRKDGYNIITERVFLKNGRATNVWKYTLIED